MQITCLQENLNKAIGMLNRVAPNRAAMPIVQNVLLKAKDSRLQLTATNLEISMTTWIEAQVEEEGQTTIPIRFLNDFINSLPHEPIAIRTGANEHSLHFTCQKAKANIAGADPENYPPVPHVDEDKMAVINASDFRQAIARVTPCAATQEARPVLTGVNIAFEDTHFAMAAADGFRLAVQEGALDQPVPEPFSIIVPARTLTELQRARANSEEPVRIAVASTPGHVLFRTQSPILDDAPLEITSQLLQGTFPNYEQLVPKDYETYAVIKTSELARATKTAAIFSEGGARTIRLHMENAQDDQPARTLVAGQSDDIGDHQEYIPIEEIGGNNAKIAFNSHYLGNLLNTINTEKIKVQLTNASSPGLFKPAESDDYTQVIMPMFVNNL